MDINNLEIVMEELEKFETKGDSGEASEILEEYLKFVARTGDPLLPWNKVKTFLRHKLSSVMGEFYDFYGGNESVESTNTSSFSHTPSRNKILQHFDSFVGAPFTIQRLCEILVNPRLHYKRADKFMRGLEKNILVVSFVEPGHWKVLREEQQQQQQSIANGLQDNDLSPSPPPPHLPFACHSSTMAASLSAVAVAAFTFVENEKPSPSCDKSTPATTNGHDDDHVSAVSESSSFKEKLKEDKIEIKEENQDLPQTDDKPKSANKEPTPDVDEVKEPQAKRPRLDDSQEDDAPLVSPSPASLSNVESPTSATTEEMDNEADNEESGCEAMAVPMDGEEEFVGSSQRPARADSADEVDAGNAGSPDSAQTEPTIETKKVSSDEMSVDGGYEADSVRSVSPETKNARSPSPMETNDDGGEADSTSSSGAEAAVPLPLAEEEEEAVPQVAENSHDKQEAGEAIAVETSADVASPVVSSPSTTDAATDEDTQISTSREDDDSCSSETSEDQQREERQAAGLDDGSSGEVTENKDDAAPGEATQSDSHMAKDTP